MDTRLLDALWAIPPAELDYNQWCQIGMALKQEGFDCAVWDAWSRADQRYHDGECEKKWSSFKGMTGSPVTGGTIVELAKRYGYNPVNRGEEIGWNDVIADERTESDYGENLVVVNREWLEGKTLPPPMGDAAQQLIAYLETLFDSSDVVGYSADAWERDDGKPMPKKGCWDRTAGELIEELSNCNGDIGMVIGDTAPNVGGWIRFNPLDGQGCRNENVTTFNFALVESDEMPIEEQYAVYQAMELPIAALVHSGGKSLHAIVRVDAPNYSEYQKRVDYLYKACEQNGLKIDRQNRNPSRLSRMPGVMRNGHQQALLAVNIGKKNWDEWREWIEAANDDLPDTEPLSSVWDNLPELSPPLIEGVLRQGHKLLLAGPSKAGKSFSLIELCISIAEGRPWMGFPCAQGRVLYVNLELDRPSCLHRFKDVYTALGWQPEHIRNIDIWNLRGHSVPMDKLAPKLIRRASKQNYLAVVIDPIYKVITGDENSADQMAHFCNQFDKVCTELGCAVIYCHHHSKGAQGGKRSMDRASGSGVFARDPDALLDMIELELTEDARSQRKNAAACRLCKAYLARSGHMNEVGQDDLCNSKAALAACEKHLSPAEYNRLFDEISESDTKEDAVTAWRIEGTLREFPRFKPLNAWFAYPIHELDDSGVLADIQPESDRPGGRKSSKANLGKSAKAQGKSKLDDMDLDGTFDNLSKLFKAGVTSQNFADALSTEEAPVSRQMLDAYIKKHPEKFTKGENGTVHKTMKS